MDKIEAKYHTRQTSLGLTIRYFSISESLDQLYSLRTPLLAPLNSIEQGLFLILTTF